MFVFTMLGSASSESSKLSGVLERAGGLVGEESVFSTPRICEPPSGSFYPFVVYTTIATAIATVFMVLPWLVAPQVKAGGACSRNAIVSLRAPL